MYSLVAALKSFLYSPPNSSRFHLKTWIAQAAAGVDSGALVLDAGAGGGPYRSLFQHATYESADFAQLDKSYTDLTYTCDLTSIPVEDCRFDLVVLNQVLEHLPDPLAVMLELKRVLKPGCELWASAPLFYEEHEQPYDFYRYTQFAWRRLAERAGLEIVEIAWLEGYDGTLSYQLSMAARELPSTFLPLRLMFALLARYFARRDMLRKDATRGMCKNYTCVLRRPGVGA